MYAELHCHSNYSFQEGASSIEDLLVRSKELGYRALALTDHDNLCGAMHFAQVARTFEMQAITGVEATLKDGSHLTLLAQTRQGYSNLCNAVSYSYITGERRDPGLDPGHLPDLSDGVVLLTGCRNGRVPRLLSEERTRDAEEQLEQYLERFGAANVFVELQQNLVRGDTQRNRRLVELARQVRCRGGRHQQRPLPRAGASPAPGLPGRHPTQPEPGRDPPGTASQRPVLPQVPLKRWRSCSASAPMPSKTPCG